MTAIMECRWAKGAEQVAKFGGGFNDATVIPSFRSEASGSA
jgi:hypothetical protein